MISTVAAGSSESPAVRTAFLVLMGVMVLAGLTLTIFRVRRSTKPREEQVAALAAQLDGRNQVYVRKMEIGLAREDLIRVAYSRGYSLIDHRVGKYYEFVFTPHQPGRLA
ncbi:MULTISPECIES: hypothetical protein [unclassified Amycolatopsis]|uniref:hypothetical protein n=1 Tax=unclassified Amycolatopsis TaxID=2618356 RepID=UPI002876D8CF|nr:MULTISPECIES: hypothetical protein [unclassified Amycolatopsis]MDS0133863.1 hypothetical protein [Amycolatopsis sp. 505]MDS0144739.1 hypothetical protein [Amycolatopsis sp. CM201R]